MADRVESDSSEAPKASSQSLLDHAVEIAKKDSIVVETIVDEAFKTDASAKEETKKIAKELAESEQHERTRGAIEHNNADEGTSSISLKRREFLKAALYGATVSYGLEKAIFDPALDSTATALKRAAHGKAFKLTAPLAELIRLRRSSTEGLTKLGLLLWDSPDAYRLVSIVKQYNEGGSAAQSDIIFLEEIARGDVCKEIRYLSVNHLTSELNRKGYASQGLHRLMTVDEKSIPGDQLPNHLNQLINLTYNQNMQSVALDPEKWKIVGFLEQISAKFHDELNMKFSSGRLARVPDFTDAEVGRGAHYLLGVYPHLIFFAFHYEAMRLRNTSDRRRLWDQQLLFYRKILDRRIVSSPFVWQVWNHLFLLALSAFRVDDQLYLNKFLSYLFGEGHLWQDIDIGAHIHARKIALNEQYIFAVILVEALKLRDVELPLSVVKFDTELPYLLRLSGRIPHVAAGRAMNQFSKLLNVPLPNSLKIVPFLTATESHDIYVAEIR